MQAPAWAPLSAWLTGPGAPCSALVPQCKQGWERPEVKLGPEVLPKQRKSGGGSWATGPEGCRLLTHRCTRKSEVPEAGVNGRGPTMGPKYRAGARRWDKPLTAWPWGGW